MRRDRETETPGLGHWVPCPERREGPAGEASGGQARDRRCRGAKSEGQGAGVEGLARRVRGHSEVKDICARGQKLV